MRDLAEAALDAARAAGADYAEVRIVRRRVEEIRARGESIAPIQRTESEGLSVRCLAGGAWGFAAAGGPGSQLLGRIAQEACAAARESRKLMSGPVELAPEPAHLDAWQTPLTKDPFKVSTEAKISLLLAAHQEALRVPDTTSVTSFLISSLESVYFASTGGSRLDQDFTRVWPGLTVVAGDARTGAFASRDLDASAAQAGFEHAEEALRPARAAQAAEEAVQTLRAPVVAEGAMDLVLDPSALWPAILHTIGPYIDLDVALGREDPSDGTALARPSDLGSKVLGGERLNVTADRTMRGGLATAGYDDEGVRAGSWPLVRGGILVGFATTREQARQIGEPASRGAAAADGWGNVPLSRLPNIAVEPAGDPVGVEDLIAGIGRGLYCVGTRGWSVSSGRTSFQIVPGFVRAIARGKLGAPVRGAACRAAAIPFWKSMDGVGGEATWGASGTLRDVKGVPPQERGASFGSPAARFRAVPIVPGLQGEP
ncbi:MAG: TldD/PmbA family protein [Acidobacteria bacterium]|nr:TldD/PmbA family protein [Acidobacteriota bacterium]